MTWVPDVQKSVFGNGELVFELSKWDNRLVMRGGIGVCKCDSRLFHLVKINLGTL